MLGFTDGNKKAPHLSSMHQQSLMHTFLSYFPLCRPAEISVEEALELLSLSFAASSLLMVAFSRFLSRDFFDQK